MENSEWSGIRRDTVSDILGADEKYARAISAALGDMAEYIVVDTAVDAMSGIDQLKRESQGRATFICLDRLPDPTKPTAAIGLNRTSIRTCN